MKKAKEIEEMLNKVSTTISRFNLKNYFPSSTSTLSRELNYLKVLPLFIFALGFLPILPYEINMGFAISIDRKVANNFYAIGLRGLNKNYKKEGDPFYELYKLSDIIPHHNVIFY